MAFARRRSRPRVVPRPATTQISGQRSQTIVTKVRTAKAAASGGPRRLLPSVVISLMAVAMISPAATAPMPRSAPETTARRENSAYAAVSTMTMTSGTASMPATAASAPFRPKKRSPSISAEVDDVRSGQDLAEREHLDEFLAREPALALDELALRDREDAAESLQREAIEGEEEVAGRRRPGRAVAPPASRSPAGRGHARRPARPAGPDAERDRRREPGERRRS